MTFGHINRRLHLYLGLALLPWFFMYGISSVPFAHNQFFERRDAAKGLPQWTLRAEHEVELPIPADAAALRGFGAELLARAGMPDVGAAAYGVYRQGPTQVNVYWYTFRQSTQLKYFSDRKRLTVEDRRFRWDHFLTGMHARGGFEQGGWLQRSWSVVVDLVCVGILLWIASGLYMWWGVPASRRWGVIAIAAGTVSFLVFTVRL
jgi:hypothetical protein